MTKEQNGQTFGESFNPGWGKSITGSRNLSSQSTTTTLMVGQFSPIKTPTASTDQSGQGNSESK